MSGRMHDVVARAGVPAVVLGSAVVALQVAYPLAPAGAVRDGLTVVTVLVFFAASVAHAALRRGGTFAAWLVLVGGGVGLAVEVLGVATDLPFGPYEYTGSLGPRFAGVPLVIPLAWTMMAYPAFVAARWLVRAGWARVAVGAWALAAWDLYLDPQMVDAGHWAWHSDAAAVMGIPWTNFAGWALVAVVVLGLLELGAARLGADRPADRVADAVPLALYLWVYASSLLAHLAFLGLRSSAVLGGIGMGMVAVPLAARLRRGPA